MLTWQVWTDLETYAVFQLIVAGNIASKCAQKDERDHAGEEQDNHQGIENAKPLNFGLRLSVKNIVLLKKECPYQIQIVQAHGAVHMQN